jgi:Skp family chaperone for outer membrane proteins
MKLSDRALLVQLNISTWSANKLDKEISAETNNIKGVQQNAGRYHKSLLPMCDLLDDIKKKASLIRQRFYDNTLPWGVKGTQILPTANYLAFMTEFRKERAEYEALVNRFVPAYPQLVVDAQRFLGAAYKPTDYPEAHEIGDKFKMDMQVMPVPNNDFRVNIADAELERIHDEVEARVKQAGQQAMQDVWQRLYDKVKHYADKMDDPKAIFRDSTVEHLVDLCDLLPRLNVMEDPNLEAMRQEVEAKLAGIQPDTLRADPKVRETAATEANDIAAKMAAFMGGLN